MSLLIIKNLFSLVLYYYLSVYPVPRSLDVAADFIKTSSKQKKIIILSDTQSPLWIEELFLTENDNEKGRDFLLSNILNEQPAAIFHLGDLVSLGFHNDSWQAIDNWMKQLSKLKIPLYPTLGNHELLFFSEMGEKNFKIRFVTIF